MGWTSWAEYKLSNDDLRNVESRVYDTGKAGSNIWELRGNCVHCSDRLGASHGKLSKAVAGLKNEIKNHKKRKHRDL